MQRLHNCVLQTLYHVPLVYDSVRDDEQHVPQKKKTIDIASFLLLYVNDYVLHSFSVSFNTFLLRG